MTCRNSRGRALREDPLHYFEARAHETAVSRAIDQGKLPLKFAYAGSARVTHQRLSRSEGYKASNWQVNSELARLGNISTTCQLAVIDFGPGDGIHTSQILTSLVASHDVTRYTGVDFSRSLFVQARRVLIAEHPDLRVDFQWADLEQPFSLIHDPTSARQVLFLAIGGLLGNVEDHTSSMLNIFGAVPNGCLGLISVSALLPGAKADEYVDPYRTSEFRDAALEPLRAAGYALNEEALRLIWDENTKAVVGVADLHAAENDDRAENSESPPSCSTPRRQIRVFLSRRFTLEEVSQLVRSAGFDIVDIAIDGTARRIDAIVRKP